jgi:hypothetical protein
MSVWVSATLARISSAIAVRVKGMAFGVPVDDTEPASFDVKELS